VHNREAGAKLANVPAGTLILRGSRTNFVSKRICTIVVSVFPRLRVPAGTSPSIGTKLEGID
jgi:hypothetical protein